MWDYRARWKSIGIELRVDTGTLDAIEADNRKVNDCLQEVIKYWLRNSPRPTRETIKVALQSKLVSNAAGNLASGYNYELYHCECMCLAHSVVCKLKGGVNNIVA